MIRSPTLRARSAGSARPRRALDSVDSADVAVASTRRSFRRPATWLSVDWSIGSASSRVTVACLMAPSRSTRMRLAIRSLTATRSTRRMWAARGLAGVAMPGRAGQPGERRRGEAEPVLAGELDLAELVADHQLLDGRQRAGIDDRLDIEAIARRRSASRPALVCGCVSSPARLQLGEDVADSGARHAEAVALDERLAADRLCRRDVFLDDGPKDRLGAEVQRAEWAACSSRQTRSPVVLALDG